MQHVAFECPPLGPTATEHWNDASVEACVETIQAVEAVRAYPVYGVYTDPTSGASMTLHAGHEPGNAANYSMCGHTQLRASLAEAAACFQRLNTHEADSFVSMLGRPILGSTTLYTLMEPSEESPMQYTGIEWTAFEAPRLGDFTPIRDLCYLESQNQFFHQGEQRHGWVRSLHSIDVDACPPFAQDIYRAEIYQSGQVFVQSATPGVLDCYSLCSIDLKYTLPERDHMAYLTKWVTQMLTLHAHIATQRAACARAVHSAVTDGAHRFVCPTCNETIAGSKATCRECDRPICESCHPKWSLTSMWRRLQKSQVCVECSEELRGVSLLERNTTSESWECTTRSTLGSTETTHKRPSSLIANYARDLETVWIDVSSVDSSSAAQTPTGDDIPVARAAKPRDEVKLHELLDSYHARKLMEDPRVQQLYKDLVALDRS
ncbi:hypothetical protein SPRG_16336 [Saprolegnia parasitica CBS 223.65]|uniref:FYVE-type domain-containing protein n=1 Tax=Saprolegnia parasitica (strain CBS 223.65) TaxID=695850 RepID=A0A067BUG5_SAPPC|nr:hypothetical protein SPRG_16336 [Saprolegnia parasitica CBS 223.65]KDO18232.1 hypothetical protein SPRG_16336 [Saprolegnia parasitica CBS 223.65]|eukprot:XP_012211065.1 hypothetical protein SPRG_16336 [Saprolegnia parasitica CBS 223.65]